MRILSVVLLACIVLLSSFGDMAKPAAPAVVMDCCKKENTSCHKAPSQKKKNNDGCKEPGCTMMFSCQLCGFIVQDTIMLKAVQAYSLPKPVTPYIISAITGYKADNWKPPKNC